MIYTELIMILHIQRNVFDKLGLFFMKFKTGGLFCLICLIVMGCGARETFNHGFRASEDDIAQVPIGSSVEQVRLVFGSPSTVSETGDNPIWYYISQKSQSDLFVPRKVVDQRVLAITIDENERVSNIADYGLKDGKLFDFVSKTTPTGGTDMTLLQRVFSIEALRNG